MGEKMIRFRSIEEPIVSEGGDATVTNLVVVQTETGPKLKVEYDG